MSSPILPEYTAPDGQRCQLPSRMSLIPGQLLWQNQEDHTFHSGSGLQCSQATSRVSVSLRKGSLTSRKYDRSLCSLSSAVHHAMHYVTEVPPTGDRNQRQGRRHSCRLIVDELHTWKSSLPLVHYLDRFKALCLG